MKSFSGQVWKSLGDDDVMFLASGVSFNLLLAAVPFVLLLASVSILFLGSTPDSAADVALGFLDRLLPTNNWSDADSVRDTVRDIARVSGSVTLYSSIGFLWFSTRVFSSMRSVFQKTFDVPNERGILHGKLFDIACSLIAASASRYGSLERLPARRHHARGASVLTQLGVRESVMGPIEYGFGRVVAFLLVVLLCFTAYRLVPNRPIPSRTAWVGSITTSLFFELARIGFGRYVQTFSPSSLYTGAIATLVVVTLWTYYASLIFIIGAEVAQVVELRRHPTTARQVIDLRSDTVTRPTAGHARRDGRRRGGRRRARRRSDRAATRDRGGARCSARRPRCSSRAARWPTRPPSGCMRSPAPRRSVMRARMSTTGRGPGRRCFAACSCAPSRLRARRFVPPMSCAALRTPSRYAPRATLLCLENTHNGAGGAVTPLAELQALGDVGARTPGSRCTWMARACGTPTSPPARRCTSSRVLPTP